MSLRMILILGSVAALGLALDLLLVSKLDGDLKTAIVVGLSVPVIVGMYLWTVWDRRQWDRRTTLNRAWVNRVREIADDVELQPDWKSIEDLGAYGEETQDKILKALERMPSGRRRLLDAARRVLGKFPEPEYDEDEEEDADGSQGSV